MKRRAIFAALQANGLLLLSDPFLPSVVGLAGGTKEKGSWWGHSNGHEIFRTLVWLESQPDVIATRLVSGKVTYLHRRLWQDFLSVATSRGDWQLAGLTRGARTLLGKVDSLGEVTTKGAKEGDSARELESRLLAYGEEIHTETGSHAKVLMSWPRCPKIRDLRIPLKDPELGKDRLGSTVDALNETHSGRGKLPWRQN